MEHKALAKYKRDERQKAIQLKAIDFVELLMLREVLDKVFLLLGKCDSIAVGISQSAN